MLPKDRLFRGYGPLIGFAAIFLAVAVLVPSQQREVRTVESAGATARRTAAAQPDAEVAGAEEEAGSTDPAATDPAAAGADPAAGGAAPSGPAAGATPGGPGAAAKGPPTVAGCGSAQVPGDPYAPPCTTFTGNNGGATSRGVTGDTITVAVRIQGFSNGILDAVSKVAGATIPDESADVIVRTVNGLTEYFNKRFQFYGRKLKLVVYDGKGDVLKETTGGGQEGAQADALKVAQEIQAFADVSAVTPVYADALSSKQVVNVGAPFVSREWLTQRRPFSWSPFPDCSTVVESVASYYATKLYGSPAALAGGELRGRPRQAAIIAPENSWYQECVNAGIGILQKAGRAGELALTTKYQLDIPRMSSQADTVLRQLKDRGITTVVCGCDPLFLTFLTAKAKEQGFFPEWVMTGVAFVDNDLIGQILQRDVWSRAFGVSFAGPTQAAGTGLGYRAYKSVRPDEPSIGVELLYNQLDLLAIGIQMAGPALTPQSFEKGMFDYPRRTGPSGTWGFGPGDYATAEDAREVFWNPAVGSPQNRRPGAYQDPNAGARFPIGRWPATPPRSAAG
ncbi:MAG: hypothetical protein ACOYOP_09035 [Microthrixaceae bacterium]